MIMANLTELSINSELSAKLIIRRVFNLSKKQLECFLQLLETAESGTCIRNLESQLDSERSIVQKYLKILLQKGLVKRKAISLQEFKEKCITNSRVDLEPRNIRGYLYIYQPINVERLLQKIRETTDSWNYKMKEFLINE